MEIYPSLISSNLLNLENSIRMLDSVCHGYHIDVMDDHFVPNLTWGPAFVNAFSHATKLPLHVHLMVDNPQSWINRLSLRAYDSFIFHIEASKTASETNEIIDVVCKTGVQVGIAINPETSVKTIEPYLNRLNIVLLMSVQPGFSGQKFMPGVLDKVTQLIKWRNEKQLSFKICMDGGIGSENISTVHAYGVQQVGAAAAIFASSDPKQAVLNLQSLCKNK